FCLLLGQQLGQTGAAGHGVGQTHGSPASECVALYECHLINDPDITDILLE
uniref:Uncharacterized protein n=1 Tax=Astyanax mexicanus TaxID=7994 RepID=A0A8B9HA74_ASTMX